MGRSTAALLATGALLALVGCELPWADVPCPEGAAADEEGLCACEPETWGELSWDEDSEAYVGSCRTGLEMALQTGDPSYLDSADAVLEAARSDLASIRAASEALLRAIYGSEPVVYDPSAWSSYILTTSLEDNVVLVQGSEAGYSLAVAGQQGEARYSAFGFNLLVSFANGEQAAYRTPFDRLLAWQLGGSADSDVPESVSVGLASIGWDHGTVAGWLEAEYPDWELSNCDDPSAFSECFVGQELLVVGAQGAAEDAEALAAAVDEALSSGAALIFLHTETWATSTRGEAVLEELGMSYGGYGGNFWEEDRADWASVEDMLGQGGVIGGLDALLGHLQADDYDFDWSHCTTWVGQVFCDAVPGLRSEFLNGAEAVKQRLEVLDRGGHSLFEQPGERVWKLMALLADVYRRDTVYPMSKTDEDIMPFLRAYYSDHAVHYRRELNPAQVDLGSFSGLLDPDVLELSSPELDVEVSRHGGYTAVGHYALPGERFTVELVDGGGLEVSLLINTQRTGSTREFNDGQYDRPKFLQSPALPLYEGEEVTLSTPFGGTLQLAVSESESDGAVRLRLGSVGSHAVLDQGADPLDYLADLETTLYPFTELRNPYVQIHSRADMMLESIDSYDGDLEAFFFDLDHYMILDTYNLAGFAGQELELNASVEAFCSELDWDCSSEALHGRPKLQHINVDAYAHCGGGCSGNPYDQAWALGPLGWGETHEIGHNLQRGRLSIYGGRSSEVSNQIFPLHKHWSFRADGGESLSADRPSYLATFEILQSAASSADPAGETYEAIWSAEGIYDNNGERMVFYMQVVHGSDDVPWLESGWDVYTLMYLHERLFTDALLGDWASQRDGLGFGTYSAAPDGMEANDFMLISMSFITGRDQRPFFELWGIDFTEAAGAQVASYGFEPVPRQFFASVDANAPPHPEPVPIDGVSLWPL